MKQLLLVLLNLTFCTAIAQELTDPQAQFNVEEGKRLYRSEMASWHGTDLFLESKPDHTRIGGYFSYLSGDKSSCIFYSNDENPVVLATISFDSTYQLDHSEMVLEERPFSGIERAYFEMKKNALIHIESATIFKFYKETNLNLIPLIHNGEKKVYVLTASTRNDVVLFGNDYIINMNEQNEVVDSKALHANLIPIEYQAEGKQEEEIIGTIHSHLPSTGSFITATDVCTLMLYAPYTNWQSHNVVSEQYLNVWNCKTNSLSIIPMKGVKKILKAQDKREKKEQKRSSKSK
jgi:hypothetical protein